MLIFYGVELHHSPLAWIFLLPKPIPTLPHTANPKPHVGSELASIPQTTIRVTQENSYHTVEGCWACPAPKKQIRALVGLAHGLGHQWSMVIQPMPTV